MKNLVCLIGLLAATLSASGVSLIVPNGSFENGTLPSNPPSFPPETLDPAVALPKWNISGSPLYYQSVQLGGPVIALLTLPASDGTNSIFLQAGFGGATNPVSIWQILTIPPAMKSITFQSKEAYDPNFYPPGYYLALLVSAAGTPVVPNYISTDASGFKTFAIDVTPYAGTSVELKFSVDPMGNLGNGGAYSIDNIRYTTSPVPEPGALTLLGIGVVVCGLYLRANCKAPPAENSRGTGTQSG